MTEPASLSTVPLVCFNALLAILVLLPILVVLGDGLLRLCSRHPAPPRWTWETVPGIGRLPVLRDD